MKLKSDFDRVKSIVLAKPSNFNLKTIIDPISYKYKSHPIDRNLLIKNYEYLKDSLLSENINVIELEGKYTYSVFTRDLGVLLNNDLFLVGNLKHNIRKPEVGEIITLLNNLKMNYIVINSNIFEGGNMIIYNENTIILGVSERTDIDIVKILEPYGEVLIVDLPKEFIHLDLAINFASREIAIGYLDSIPLDVNYFRLDYDLWYRMIPNFLVIEDGKILAPEENRKYLKILEKEGIDVIYTPFSEIMKGGGSIRCATLPIERV